MNQQGVQPVSGWQGMAPPPLNATEQGVLNGQGPTGQYQVDSSPQTGPMQAGTPNTAALSSLAMLAMLA